jgi:hypothetical protein
MSAALFGFATVFASPEMRVLGRRLATGMPARGLAVFLVASGLVVLAVWGVSAVSALVVDAPPDRLDTYTTPVTYALDLGIIAPVTITAGMLVWRGNPLGYRIAVPLMVLEAMLAPLITAQTVSQVRAGVSFPPAQIIGPIAGFLVLAVAVLWFIRAAWRVETAAR